MFDSWVIDITIEFTFDLWIALYDTNDVFEIYESGGGGYGPPKNRSEQKVCADVIDGLVSVEKAKEYYGVVIDPQNHGIDRASTDKLRDNL